MPRVYYLAYQFLNNEKSTQIWEKVRDVLEKAENVSLSAYNMQLLSNQQWCVTLVGRMPSESRQKQLKKLCEGGTPIRLSDSEVGKLIQARLEGVREGDWVIKHHYPGKHI